MFVNLNKVSPYYTRIFVLNFLLSFFVLLVFCISLVFYETNEELAGIANCSKNERIFL